VIAPSRGGALETVRDRVTGKLWDGGAAELAAAVANFDDQAVDPEACVVNARRFDASVFRATFPREVERALNEAEHRGPHHKSADRRFSRFSWSPVRR
jgi:hypothetical protein